MTDPNVIEAMNLLPAAVCSLATKGLSHKPSDAQHAIDLADEASELLAAAEKPAAQTDGPVGIALGGALMFPPGGAEKPAEAAPVVTGGIQFDPEGHAISPTTGKTTHVDPDGWFGFANKERAGVYVKASGLESARRAVRAMRDAGIAAVRGEVAAAPTVAAVRFDAKGDAAGPGWEAESFALESPRRVSVTVDLRPGEDAGETVAKMLAACGRGP